MPKVVVYVPAAAWRKLEQRGLDPAATVREFARRGYETSDTPITSEPTQRITAATGLPEQTVKMTSGGCPMNPPRGTKCKVCGKVHPL